MKKPEWLIVQDDCDCDVTNRLCDYAVMLSETRDAKESRQIVRALKYLGQCLDRLSKMDRT